MNPEASSQSYYWNHVAGQYQSCCRISVHDFHYGPLLPGDAHLHLLPPSVKDWRCFEFGCGAGQNSIFLAGRGAKCVALDVADAQLEHGRALAGEHGVDVDFQHGCMEDLPTDEAGSFDLVHSVYALPFTDQPGNVLGKAASLLREGGWLVLSTVHPLFVFEWLELDGEGMGSFVPDYFHPPDELRVAGGEPVRSRSWPVSAITEWMAAAGLVITRLAEPLPLDPEDGVPPYTSDDWEAWRAQLEHVPSTVIFVARKLSST